MSGSFTLFKLFGIPIRINLSWLLVVALVTWSLGAGYFPQEYRGLPAMTYWILGGITSILFFASVLVHELAHSLVARREGVPVRSITLFIFGGVSEIGEESPSPGAEFRISVVGPLTSLVLAAFFGLLLPRLTSSQVAAAPAVYLGRINLLLALFNLIPGFPLDGGRVLRSILWKLGNNLQLATRWAARIGQLVAFLFIIAGAALLFTGNVLNGLWLAFIGWFLNSAAQSSARDVALRHALAGVRARDVMTQQCPTIPGSLHLDALVQDHVLSTGNRCFFVSSNGGLEGLVTLHNIKQVPRDRWTDLTVEEVMTPTTELARVRPDDDVISVMAHMEQADVNQVPVMEDGHLLGVITREHLLHYIRTRSELSE
jgi:Zn-dependent protease/CBS domain-containing protein